MSKKYLFFIVLNIFFIKCYFGQEKLNLTNIKGLKIGKWEIRDTIEGIAYKNVFYFKNGKINGEYVSYFSDDNTIAAIINYSNGFKNGVSKYFYQNKSISDVWIFINNKSKYHAKYKPNGELFQENYDGIYLNYEKGKTIDTLNLSQP